MTSTLPALIDRARTRLGEARTSAEVLEARAAAKAALHYARLQKAANETQADCLAMIKRAEIRMANEIDAARGRGELARIGDFVANQWGVRDADTPPATLEELGLSRQRVAEWRDLRDAGETVIDDAIEEALNEGRAPTHADIQRAVKGGHHRTRFTGETEWYTPAQYVEAARACLGAIDLDPAPPRPRRRPSAPRVSSPATTTASSRNGTGASGSTRLTHSRTSRASSTSCSWR